MTLSRRSFLKGSLLAGATATTAALAGCASAPKTETPQTGESGSAPQASAAHTWEVAPEPITDIAEEKTFDVVIVGAGIAGNAAAEAAARNGASVAVLEQAPEFTIHGVDCGCIGAKFQKEWGIEIDPYEAAKLIYNWSQNTANYDLILTWALKSGQVFDHLADITGARGFTPVQASSPTAKWGWGELDEKFRIYEDGVLFSEVGQDNGFFTKDGVRVTHHVIWSLVDEAMQHGAEYFYNTHAEQLVGNAATGISGVIATAEDGSHVQFNAAKGVILATGDISGNQEMIDAFAPICNRADRCDYTPLNGNLGEGVLMGMWAGAAHQFCPAAPMVHPIDRSDYGRLGAMNVSWLAVNMNGKRYCNEMPFEPMVTNARMNQPGNRSYSIYDATYADTVKRQFPEGYEKMLDGFAEMLDEGVKAGAIFRADTLEELAAQIGVPPENLVATVERYNEMCDKGEDTDFGVPPEFLCPVKEPPFVAKWVPALTLVVPFGLHVNLDSQVLTQDEEVIEGLYAIGNVQGDFFANSYPVHCPGLSHGRGLTFGQLVGEALAKDTVLTAL